MKPRIVAQLSHPVLIFILLITPALAVAASEPVWREVDPENLVFMELFEGDVVIELNSRFAPETVSQFKKLIKERFYRGLSFYRVIDGFVAQAGDGSDLGALSNVPPIKAEFEVELDEDVEFTRVQKPDLFASETGFIDGFATARNTDDHSAWLTHCPGVVAMARNESPDSSRTDFYIVIGQAPRYLDRNMNIFGRVVHGMDVVQKIYRGPANDNGIIEDETKRSRIRDMKLASDIPRKERLAAFVPDTNSKSFKGMLKDRRNRKQKFFVNTPPEVLDVCQIPMAGRVTK